MGGSASGQSNVWEEVTASYAKLDALPHPGGELIFITLIDTTLLLNAGRVMKNASIQEMIDFARSRVR